MTLRDKVVHILRNYVLPLYTIGFAILWIVIVIWCMNEYQKQPYWNAKRARSSGDIELATQLFEEAVRQDGRALSFKALLTLMEMDELCALEKLICLIDIPDLNWIVSEDRERMCKVIRQ